MGYSCTAIASLTHDALMEIVRDSESSNSYRGYFTEQGRENSGGAITGTVWKFVDENHVRRAGSYKIDAEGKIIRFLGTTKKEWIEAEKQAKIKFAKMYPTFAGG